MSTITADSRASASRGSTIKVPEVTAGFWIIKILCTTLGETAGDAVSMSMNLGYLAATGIFAAIFALSVWVQIKARSFHPVIYWATIITTTTVGTTMADFATRDMGIGYSGGSALLLGMLLLSLLVWYKTLGTISVQSISTPSAEVFYWVTILFSQTLGTALGDWTSDSLGEGYFWSAIIFGSLLAILALCYFVTKISHTVLFWAAFVLTRPLGAVVGDLLDKSAEKGGYEISRYTASGVLFAMIVVCLFIFPQRASQKAH